MILRRRALGNVVLVSAIAPSLPRPVMVRTEARYHPVVRRMIGVDEALDWAGRVPDGHQVIDLQRGFRKHSLVRRLRLFGVGHGRPEVTALYATAADTSVAQRPWIALRRAPRTDLLVLLVGASTPLKRVPVSLLIAVARAWPGSALALGGPGDDRALADLQGAVAVTHDVVGFERTFEVLSRAKVVLGGDTGLAHLAAACGIPTVVVAGPTHPDDGFLGSHFARVVQRELSCRPCTLHRATRCRRGDRACFDLDPRHVIRAVIECAG